MFFLINGFDTGVDSQYASEGCMKGRILLGEKEKILLFLGEIAIDFQVLALQEAAFVQTYNHIRYLSEHFLLNRVGF
jgi:hypothetical protein